MFFTRKERAEAQSAENYLLRFFLPVKCFTIITNKNTNTNKVYINKHSYNFLKNSNLFGGEVILPNIGSVGDVYIMPENLYEHMSLAPNSIMLKTKYSNKYFYYYFFS